MKYYTAETRLHVIPGEENNVVTEVVFDQEDFDKFVKDNLHELQDGVDEAHWPEYYAWVLARKVIMETFAEEWFSTGPLHVTEK